MGWGEKRVGSDKMRATKVGGEGGTKLRGATKMGGGEKKGWGEKYGQWSGGKRNRAGGREQVGEAKKAASERIRAKNLGGGEIKRDCLIKSYIITITWTAAHLSYDDIKFEQLNHIVNEDDGNTIYVENNLRTFLLAENILLPFL